MMDPTQDLLVLDARQPRPPSHRRPLTRPTPRTWFLRTPEFRRYALREVSSLIVGLWAIHLIGGVVAINRGIDHWTAWLAWHRHPAAVAFTALALIAAVYHAVTWFHLAPAIVRVRLGARRVPRWIIIAAQYGAALVVVALGTWWVLGVAAP